MADKNTSTLQSYADQAIGAIQSAVGSLTGNTADEKSGEAKKDKASVEHDLSHATAKVGNLSASTSGAVTVDDPNRSKGSWNQTVGSGKEMLGNLTGAEGLKQEGRQQNLEGQGQEAQGQLNDLGEGFANRVSGAVGGAVAGLTGERDAQIRAQQQHDVGKTQQRGAEHDIRKQNA